ncbi:hypothetical protein [Kitasatospora sp. LaBMicrA B282]|uniref:hypothetical protein n=1 Tax=Kitasatospora sp. LaBMicrA B282 TaxID=3420949 RepID=UPI003D0E1FAC
MSATCWCRRRQQQTEVRAGHALQEVQSRPLAAAGASYVQTRRQAGVDAFARLIDELADDEVGALVAALPAPAHLAEL